ncbi:methylmalonyl-CoA carboxyltransferase [Aquabacter sp. L1I39]|uniref:acyl-CoA carboxylase subunit beta n=1 Tax=Aquabacter sp. L1I39 TaxID=2820278 RepID=UPI001ADD36E9|nr:carboxyl transferase domain-containing protein [Aquabacter sp. L1I39]QTL04084.1 methylmalonyl-CoA carboxyltransferase [Aquabacter sp. L1I39]
MAFETERAELEARRARALAMGSPKRLAERKKAGILNARERVAHLTDAGSFAEWGLLAVSARAEDHHRSPADGYVSGTAFVEGRPVVVHAADFTTLGASTSAIGDKKFHHAKANAAKNGVPLVLLNECAGSRIPDIMGAQGLHRAGEHSELWRDRSSPWAAAILGLTYGDGSFYASMSDFVVMRKGAVMAVSSEHVTSVALAEANDPREFGGWEVQTQVTGVVDRAVDTDEEALDLIKRFLSYLPSHGQELPPRIAPGAPGGDQDKLLDLLPESPKRTYDVRRMLEIIFDAGTLFPLKERFAPVAYTGLARLAGETVGVIAINPQHKGGALDADACDKVVSFIVLCDSFNIPLITFADTPGFLVGAAGERQKMPGKIMNYLQALGAATVPKLSVILRKSYGQAHLNMGAGYADEMAAWFTAEVSLMGRQPAMNVLHRLKPGEGPERYAELEAELARDTSAYALAEPFMAQTVISPPETRDWLIRMRALHARRPTGGIGLRRLATWPTTY